MWERDFFFDQNPDPMWVCDAAGLRMLDANPAASAATGYDRDTLLSLPAHKLWAPEDVAAFAQECRLLSQRGAALRLRKAAGDTALGRVTVREVSWKAEPARLVRLRVSGPGRVESTPEEAEALAQRLSEFRSTLRAAQRLIKIGAWKYESWTGVLTWSPEIYSLHGVSPEQFQPSFEAFLQCVHPDERGRVAETYRQLIASDDREFDYFYRVLRPDGKVAYLRTMGEYTATPQGRLLTGVVQDVTRQVEREDRLRLLDLSVSRLNDAVIIFEARPGAEALEAQVVYVNGGLIRFTGLAEADFIGRPLAMVAAHIARGVPREVIVDILSGGVSRRDEIRLFAKDGRIWPCELDLVPVRDNAGVMTHWVAVIRDLSEKQAADQRARLNEERLRLLQRSTNDVIWDLDVRAGLLTWGENIRNLSGNPEAELVSDLASWTNLLHPEDRARVEDGFEAALDGAGENWSDEYRIVRADGEVRFIFDRGYIARDPQGVPLRIVGSMVDITRQKIAEARLIQAEKLDALGQMTGGVAHDFNNLLTVIIGNTETLQDTARDPREARLLSLISSAADRGRDLTGRLLAFARRMPLKPAVIDLQGQVARSVELMRRTFRTNIRIEIEEGDDRSCIEADPGQLDLVILNLAINARDSMKDGGVLSLATRRVPAGGELVEFPDMNPADDARALLTIRDTGEGMDEETLRRCLEPFFTTKPVGSGVGLGLSMAFGFMEQSGGQLLIRSAPGEGTTIGLLFRLSDKPLTAPATQTAESELARGSEKILLVEDDAEVRENTAGILSRLGYTLTIRTNVDDAIQFLRDGGDADLLLTDIMMPGSVDVRSLVAEAKRLLPEVQVLFVSGYPRELINADGRLPQDIEMLQKPYRRAELAGRVRTLLDRIYEPPAPLVQSPDA